MLTQLLEAIRRESIGGWLFSNFSHRDTLSDSLLGVRAESVNSRRWFYALRSDGSAVKIQHAIEPHILDHLPGKEILYSSLDELKAALYAEFSGQEWACHVSENIPVISFLDAGTLSLLESCGMRCVGAESLVQRARGLLDHDGIRSHLLAAAALAEIKDGAWNFIRNAFRAGERMTEGRVRAFILTAFERADLMADHPPIVAVGAASGDPHYDFEGEGRAFAEGDVVQLDMWAKGRAETDIYADISWIGVFGKEASSLMNKTSQDLFGARDVALSAVSRAFEAGKSIRGREVDARVREHLSSLGYASALRHRTGHGIDRECHGSGVNLDSIEFPDGRFILEGSCFSIEPGIYGPEFGMRTEIDAYIESGKARVSGAEPQSSLLLCR